MKTTLIPIGNSRGVRIPKPFIEKCGLEGELEIDIADGAVIIRAPRRARGGWAEAFKHIARRRRQTARPRDRHTMGQGEMGVEVKRFDVFQAALDPTIGREIKKKRPCRIVSPDEMNRHIRTMIIAPMTSKGRNYPSRVPCTFQGVQGQIVLDQIRTIDNSQLVRKFGRLSPPTSDRVLHVLGEMFTK